MKKIVIMLIAVVFVAANAKAQDTGSHWTFNTRAWTTNYFTCALYTLAAESVTDFLFKGSQKDSIHAERIIPKCDLVFPIGMGKKGFDAVGDIYGPYHRAFGNPIKHIGDYGIGLDASYKRGVVGIYAGAYLSLTIATSAHSISNPAQDLSSERVSISSRPECITMS